MRPPVAHILVLLIGFAAAYVIRRAFRRGSGNQALESLPVLVALAAAVGCLAYWGFLAREAAFALGGSLLILYAWYSAGARVPLVKKLNWLVILGCCLGLALGGVQVESLKVPFGTTFVCLGGLALPLTVAWLWVVAYVIASPAQAEETAVGLCSLIAAVFLVISVLQAAFVGPLPRAFSASVLGCCLGVILGSRDRLTARAGPAGRAMLGLSLATISVVGALKNTAFLVLVIPFLALALPLMETSYVLVSARRRGEVAPDAAAGSLALGAGSYSLSEYLLTMGMSQRQVALLFYFGTAYLGLIAVLLVALIKVYFALKLLLMALLIPSGAAVFYAAYRVVAPPRKGKGTVELFGISIANLTSEETLERIAEFIASERPHHVVTSDSLALVRAQRDEEFRRILERADLITPDGTGVVWAGRLLGQPLRERVSGVDLVGQICRLAAERGFSVYLLGGMPGVAEEAARVLQERCQGLNVLGTQHGYFLPEEEDGIVGTIAGLRPDVLFVGLGLPRQEKWITRNLGRLGVPVCIGVGGSFDVISGRLRRAPAWMQRCGLEWLYRAVREPKRLPRLLGLPRFLIMTARSLRARERSDKT